METVDTCNKNVILVNSQIFISSDRISNSSALQSYFDSYIYMYLAPLTKLLTDLYTFAITFCPGCSFVTCQLYLTRWVR